MKTFEERYTAWVDGDLEGAELAAFEEELKAHPEAQADRRAALSLGDLLRQHAPGVRLKNADFFNHQLQQRIAAEAPAEAVPSARPAAFPLARLAWIGAFCVVIAIGLFEFAIPTGPYQNQPENRYVAEVLEATPGTASISATAFQAEKTGVTVLWLDGLEYLPASYALK